MRLCCHPDDPPFPLLGLPRIMSTEADYAAMLRAVDLSANGITLCTGSLGARPDNDLPGMMARLGDRLLGDDEGPGGADELLAGLSDASYRVASLDILDDLGKAAQPGYPSIGRLRGLAELRGIMTALAHPAHGLSA